AAKITGFPDLACSNKRQCFSSWGFFLKYLYYLKLWPHRPQVIGSLHPIVAVLGGDVILPCHVEPQLDVEELTVEWWRADVPPDPSDTQSDYRYVHRYHDKHHEEDMKKPAYAGRTELFTDGLKHGNISLKISNVMCFDKGSYRCQIPQLGSSSIIEVTVGKFLFLDH
uniref:Ig-like domain-containing protein n=1 Tax=Sander lucioperca TaxID=283035 RepID=A0A8D0ADY9_SANLU